MTGHFGLWSAPHLMERRYEHLILNKSMLIFSLSKALEQGPTGAKSIIEFAHD